MNQVRKRRKKTLEKQDSRVVHFVTTPTLLASCVGIHVSLSFVPQTKVALKVEALCQNFSNVLGILDYHIPFQSVLFITRKKVNAGLRSEFSSLCLHIITSLPWI